MPTAQKFTIQDLPLAKISLGDRLRPVDPTQASSRAESMAEQGQLQAIMVRPEGDGYVVVVGGHRFVAAQQLGWETIRAEIRTDLDPLKARLAEIDENLERDELSAIDKAVFIAERKRVWEQLNPTAAHGGDRKSLKSKDDIKSPEWRLDRYTLETSEKTGISERVLQRVAFIGSHLSTDLIPLIRQTYLATHQGDLEKLSRMPPEQQRQALERLASGECKTLPGALGRTERDPEDVIVERFVALWGKAPAKARRRMLSFANVSPKEIDRIVNPRGVQAEVA